MKIALVDNRISKEELINLKKQNIEVLCCPSSNILYPAVSSHPDMSLHLIDDNNIIVHKDMSKDFINKLKSLNLNVFLTKNSLQNKYPEDIMLNAVNLNSIFMHKLKHTDPNLLSMIKNKKLLNINQGYSKCSTAIVSDNAVMTSDIKIATTLKENDLDVLLLPPGDILLPGLDYGFIGGCCGLLNKNTLAFYGDLKLYKYGEVVLKFLKKHNVNPLFLNNGKLIDKGSIFCLNVSI